jgi:hypothetical protein
VYSKLLANELSDKRFYGIYRGIVVDNNDPENKNRLRVQVPQLLGDAVTGWAWEIVGGMSNTDGKAIYGSFYDMTDQPIVSTTAAQVISLGSTAEANGISIVDGNKVTFEYAGTYSLTFSIQVTNLANSVEKAIFWVRTNNLDYPDSATEIDLPARKAADIPNRQVITINYVATAAAGQSVEIWWSGSSTGLKVESLPAGTAPVSPAVPSIILTTTGAGSYKRNPGQGVWVMFEGGDPNFPLWLGAF